MNILIWHVHGSWMTAFVQGDHRYLIPATADRGSDGAGRARTWEWPAQAVEVEPGTLEPGDVGVVVVQRPRDLELLATQFPAVRPGRDVRVIWLEHNAPQGRINEMLHPAAELDFVERIVHVTHTNDLFWDCGDTPTTVIEHGVIDPGEHWTGQIEAIGVVINEPVRRARVTGTDLLPRFGRVAPIDLFGMGVSTLADPRRPWLRVHEDVRQEVLHRELARRRLYLHPFRWTSLGLALIEAMQLGMPVVALATTEAHDAVPPGCGVVSNDVSGLVQAAKHLLARPDDAFRMGAAARRHAIERYGLKRFLADWDELFEEYVG